MKKQSVMRRTALVVVTVLMVIMLSGCSSKTSDSNTAVQIENTASVNYTLDTGDEFR